MKINPCKYKTREQAYCEFIESRLKAAKSGQHILNGQR